jgi:hypothetical protein
MCLKTFSGGSKGGLTPICGYNDGVQLGNWGLFRFTEGWSGLAQSNGNKNGGYELIGGLLRPFRAFGRLTVWNQDADARAADQPRVSRRVHGTTVGNANLQMI